MGFLPDRSEVVIRYLLESRSIEQPEKECILFENEERWTYKAALFEGYKAANTLAGHGIQSGENILIFLPNGQDWIRAWWGTTFLGAVIVPVNTAYKGEMLRHICQDSQARHIITLPDLATRVKTLELDLHIIEPASLIGGSQGEPKLKKPIEPWDIHAIN